MKQNNSPQRHRTIILLSVMILLGVLLMEEVIAINNWTSDNDIINGLANYGRKNSDIFYKDSSWYIIVGEDIGTFSGYVWNGTGWQTNTTINSSLPDIGSSTSPSVFYKDSSWYLISGEQTAGEWNGFVLASNQTTWVPNTTIISGLPNLGSYTRPDVFYKDVSWYLINRNFQGFVWNGTGWQTNTTINSSFGVGLYWEYPTPTIFKIDNSFYAIVGNQSGERIGYDYNSSNMWNINSTINNSLPISVDTRGSPNVFNFTPTDYYLIDSSGGAWYGYTLNLFPPSSPSVNLTSPSNNTQIISTQEYFNASLSMSGTDYDYEWKNTTYNLWFSNGTLYNQTYENGLSGNSTNVSVDINITLVGSYLWNAYACYDNTTLGNCTWGSSGNFSFQFIPFEVDAESHSSSVLETSYQTFELNITSTEGYTVSNGRLVYNGTTYSHATKTAIDSDSFNLIQGIYIPSGESGFNEENRSFYWNITLTNEATGISNSFTSDTYYQNVTELKFQLCGGNINVSMINFTLYDEINGSVINSTANATTFQATFNLGAHFENKLKNYSISNLSVDKTSFAFCTNSNESIIYADMISLISASGYAERDYIITNSTLTNSTSEISIYLIPDSSALEFFITITQNLRPLEEADVQITKYFIGEGVYKTIEIDQTDSNGKITAYLELDQNYKATIIQDGTLLGIKSFKSTCASAPCEIDLDLTTETSSVFTLLDSLYAQNVLYNLSYNSTSKIVTFDFVDTSGLANYFRMYVYNSNSSKDSSLISNQTLFTSSGTMTFNATDYSGNFKVDTYVSRSPEIFVGFITFIISEFFDALGEAGGEALLLAFLLIVTVIFGLAFKPSVLVLAIPILIHLGTIAGLLPFSPIVVTIFYIFAILGVVAMRS